VFRGFLFRGWVRTATSAVPGIVAVAAVFAIIHVQYNWFGILQVFILGLLFTWIRWRSGSMLLPMLMHAITNFYSMLQTVAVMRWLS
jgi:membrane protease YdiL (CAAX protease family)